MDALLDLRLVALTAGALVYLFLLALILGHRRPRNFERLLFFVSLALFFVYAGSLLEANAFIQYSAAPPATQFLYTALKAFGLLMLWPLIWHARYAYRKLILRAAGGPLGRGFVWTFYLIALGELGFAARLAISAHGYAVGERVWLGLIFLLVCGRFAVPLIAGFEAALDFQDWRTAKDALQRGLFQWLLAGSILIAALWLGYLATMSKAALTSQSLLTVAVMAGVIPGATLVYYSLRHNFLEYGAQRNLVYGLTATILGLLYLAFVRRVSGWLEPYFPQEATAGFLLFVLVFLFEPVERVIGPAVHRRIHKGMERLQRLTAELQESARQGSLANLVEFAEKRIREEFGLAAVRISMPPKTGEALKSPGGLGHVARIPLVKEGKEIGLLEAATTGAFLTGETSAALEFVTEQLPAMADLAKLIEEKIELERELADRERLALLGQMAASVSHNLRNPLGSMKTILQVQLENPDLPLDARHDCALVVEEIDRMNAKLTQLLKYSKPSVNGQRVGIVALARQTAALLGRDAERRNIRLEFAQPAGEIEATVSEEAVSEILSNLLVNAIEAQPRGGRVRVNLHRNGHNAEIEVEDDGPGIAAEAQARMFQPFFTTKATGTGLGLAIVARRVADLGGAIECESPVHEGRGTKFRVTIPAATNAGKAEHAKNPDRG